MQLIQIRSHKPASNLHNINLGQFISVPKKSLSETIQKIKTLT